MNGYCHCWGWARTFGVTDNSLPISNHHPYCEHYKPERFAKITYPTGASCVVDWAEVDLECEDPEKTPTVEEIWMTRDQFEQLEEFTGP